MHTRTVNTMKMRPKTIKRPTTSIADSQLSVELLAKIGNPTIRSIINSTDRQLITKSDKTSVECRYGHVQQQLMQIHMSAIAAKEMNARNAISSHCRHLYSYRTCRPH